MTPARSSDCHCRAVYERGFGLTMGNRAAVAFLMSSLQGAALLSYKLIMFCTNFRAFTWRFSGHKDVTEHPFLKPQRRFHWHENHRRKAQAPVHL